MILNDLSKFIKDCRKSTEVDITIGDSAVKATVGSTNFKVGNGNFAVYERSVDFLVDVDALTVMPATEDEIVWANKKYAIVSFNNEPPVRFSDPQCMTYRIHTKLIGAVEEEA